MDREDPFGDLKVAICAVSLAASGCASFPEIASPKKYGIRPDGSYLLSEREVQLECNQLAKERVILVAL